MRFEWNNEKFIANFKKHGLSFRDAWNIFLGERYTFVDTRFDYGEKRYITLGNLQGREVVVVHTYRDNIIRIISMRKANEREKKIFGERSRQARFD